MKSRGPREQPEEIQRHSDVAAELAEERAARRAAERSAKRLTELVALTTALSRAVSVAQVARASVAHVPAVLGATMATFHVHGDEGAARGPGGQDSAPPDLTEVTLPLQAGER